MKIYTKTGDDGTTGLCGGRRVSKADPRVAAYGDADELNSVLGWLLAVDLQPETRTRLASEQDTLFRLGAQLADPRAATDEALFEDQVVVLETGIDRMNGELELLRNFILPAGSEAVTRLHLARTVCRRAERSTVALSQQEAIDPTAISYLNRLSDYLFVAARFEGARRGEQETPWLP